MQSVYLHIHHSNGVHVFWDTLYSDESNDKNTSETFSGATEQLGALSKLAIQRPPPAANGSTKFESLEGC